ncbi:MAG TPA: SDR family oxidoreductase [Caulobacteraceae bacterium]|nr:SDR family oxidoreductase [Caulobacteraceae bacterium]
MSDQSKRVALVIGGGSGMGLASVRALAAAGHIVIVADRDGEAAKRAADEIKAAGGEAMSYEIDGSSVSQLKTLFLFIEKTYRRLNVLFSNIGMRGPMGLDMLEAQFDEVIDVNVKSHFFATHFAVPIMKLSAPHASIIYMASAGSLKAGGRCPLYNISKAAVPMMARSVARELGPAGIRVNAICPGSIETSFPRWSTFTPEGRKAMIDEVSLNIPLGRIGQPDDVAGMVAFLASDQSMFITGASIPIDGGDLA